MQNQPQLRNSFEAVKRMHMIFQASTSLSRIALQWGGGEMMDVHIIAVVMGDGLAWHRHPWANI